MNTGVAGGGDSQADEGAEPVAISDERDGCVRNIDNAISVVIGANIGTTITAQLVALNMTYIAPIIVIAGFVISHTRSRFERYGKAIFYFGVIFLSLYLISNLVTPFRNNPEIISFLQAMSNPYSAIAIGAIITVILQSSSALTGLIIILASQGLIGLPAAIGFLFDKGSRVLR